MTLSKYKPDNAVGINKMKLRKSSPWSNQSYLTLEHKMMIEELANKDGFFWNEYTGFWCKKNKEGVNKWHMEEPTSHRKIVYLYCEKAKKILEKNKK